MSARSKLVFYLPVIGMAVITIILFIPDIYSLLSKTEVPNVLVFSPQEKINTILTYAIASFAAVEAYSTYVQVVLEEKRNRIEDARNELERVYGPLYTLLKRVEEDSAETEEKVIVLDENEKAHLDNIMATYPFLFPSEIYDFWRQNVQTVQPVYELEGDRVELYYEISPDFRDMIIGEYDRTIKEYNELLKKPSK